MKTPIPKSVPVRFSHLLTLLLCCGLAQGRFNFAMEEIDNMAIEKPLGFILKIYVLWMMVL